MNAIQRAKKKLAAADEVNPTLPFVRPPGHGQAGAILTSRSLAEVEAREVRWLWPGRIPYGALSILDGDPSKGKSLITVDLAARNSCGWAMPFSGAEQPPANTLIIAAEDAVEQVIKPRAEAAGADLRRIRVAETVTVGERERPIVFPDDFALLEKEIRDTGATFVVIDPLLGFLSQAIDSHKDQSIREVLHELKLIGERTGAAVLGLRHLGKAGSGNALYRGMGSIAITAAARSALTVDAHPNEEGVRVLASAKCNIAKLPRSVTYRIVDECGRPVVKWVEECDITAEDLGVKVPGPRSAARDDAVEFLNELLAAGPVSSATIEAKARDRRISPATLRRAGDTLRVLKEKMGFGGGWVWRLPTEGAHPRNATEGAHGQSDE